VSSVQEAAGAAKTSTNNTKHNDTSVASLASAKSSLKVNKDTNSVSAVQHETSAKVGAGHTNGIQKPWKQGLANTEGVHIIHKVVPVHVPAQLGNSTDIWDASVPWAKFVERHPAGITTNVWHGLTKWAAVNYMNVRMIFIISCLAYPVAFLFFIMLIMFLVSIFMFTDDSCESSTSHLDTRSYLPNLDTIDASHEHFRKVNRPAKNSKSGFSTIQIQNQEITPVEIPPPCGEDYAAPVLSIHDLSSCSQNIYACYAYFCRCIPAIMVFGVPLTLVLLFFPFPQEVFCVLALMTSVAVFSNGVYMCVFAAFTIMKMSAGLGKNSRLQSPTRTSYESASEDGHDVRPSMIQHWVILPQYQEEVEVVSMAVMSMAQSSLARRNISLVLAMEKREADAEEKAEELKRRFSDSFANILITYHPSDLPNDPAGKASNTKWAFNCLVQQLYAAGQDFSTVMITVADADSDFHERYFEELVSKYLEAPPDERNLLIFQAAILHVKNYHRQPSPVAVGTMFTTMQELATMGDPNATQFPYSTYSLSLELVRRVGGFDAEWIAEDWHMGIKCYLLTLGYSRVVPILLPICNTTPEDTTWQGTIHARWSQAKRHALGFSDISYYFMMLPLMYAHVSAKSSESRGRYIRAFWGVAIIGLRIVIRIIGVHVVIGVITTYGVLEFLSMAFMQFVLHEERHAEFLWSKTTYWFRLMAVATVFFMLCVATLFNIVYHKLKGRIEEERGTKSMVFSSKLAHWVYAGGCFLAFGPFYFAALAYAVWRAAIMVLSTSALDYEVAKKVVLKTGDAAEKDRESKDENKAVDASGPSKPPVKLTPRALTRGDSSSKLAGD
jgi:cellulose synthase/poly-beta-1,6-N-acetylglucosamine synthase-like glycosyltransferase